VYLCVYFIEPILFLFLAWLDFTFGDDFDIDEYKGMFYICWALSFISIWFILLAVVIELIQIAFDVIPERIADVFEWVYNSLQKLRK